MKHANTYGEFWKQIQEMGEKSRAEFEATKNHIESVKGWKFVGCTEGVVWTARHKDHGEVKAPTSAALLREVASLVASDEEAKQVRGMR